MPLAPARFTSSVSGFLGALRGRSGRGPGAGTAALAAITGVFLLLPLVLPVLAGLGHVAWHLSDRMSLDYLLHSHHHVHETDGPPAAGHNHGPGGDRLHGPPHGHPSASGPQRMVGADHTHGTAVDLLLAASRTAEAQDQVAPPPPAERAVDLHVPADFPPFADLVERADPPPPAVHGPVASLADPLEPPPPRA